jgi:probable phosphoglycerate mutase
MIYYVRHGESQANADSVFAGDRFPAPLTIKGIQQAELAGQEIVVDRLQIDQIISSPLERALQTAQIIAQKIDYDPQRITIDPRLQEYDVGDMAGKTMHGVTPALLVGAPNAEDPKAFQERVLAALRSAQELPGNTLLVSHGGVRDVIEATLRHIDPALFYKLSDHPNAQLERLDAFS